MFDLDLPELGPYNLAFTRSGRHMLLGGRRGHLALMDWQQRHLVCEVQARGHMPSPLGLLLLGSVLNGTAPCNNTGASLHLPMAIVTLFRCYRHMACCSGTRQVKQNEQQVICKLCWGLLVVQGNFQHYAGA